MNIGRPSGSPGRRRVLQGAFVIGTGLALNVLGTLPPARPRSALAHHRGYSVLPGGRCYPPEYDRQPCANSNTSKIHCAGNNWHRHDSVALQPGVRHYFIRTESCSGHNAWHWANGGHVWRCSDGGYKVEISGRVSGPIKSVCPAIAG